MAEQYGSLNKLRTEIINKLMTNQNLLKFLFYTTDSDITLQPNVSREVRKNIKDKQIIEHFRVNIALESEQICYISLDFGRIPRSPEGFWMKPSFSFFIICPESLLETQNGSRILAIEQCIMDTFDGCLDLGNRGSVVRVTNSENISGVSSPYQSRRVDMTMVDYVRLNK